MRFSNALSAFALLSVPTFAALTVTYSNVSGTKVKVTVTTDKDVTLLKHPNSVVAPEFNTDIFTFEHEGGKAPEFTGKALKWDPKSTEKVELKAGESVTFEKDLSRTYDFSKCGETTYKLGGGEVFHVQSPSGDITTEKATIISTTAKFSDGRETWKREHTPVDASDEKRVILFQGCTLGQRAQINVAANLARAYIINSRTYLLTHSTITPRWATWFGPFTLANRNLVLSHYNSMINDSLNMIYNCVTCAQNPNWGGYAHVNPNFPSVIYICPAFWTRPPVGINSKAGIIVNQLSRFNVNGGCTSGLPLIRNAIRHQRFSENTPPLQ